MVLSQNLLYPESAGWAAWEDELKKKNIAPDVVRIPSEASPPPHMLYYYYY